MCKELFTKILLVALLMAAKSMTMIDLVWAEPNKFERAAAAKISIDEAIATAREKVSGTVIDVELEQKHDRLIWEIEVVTTEKQVKDVHIDAHTGTIIGVEEELVKSKRIHRRH